MCTSTQQEGGKRNVPPTVDQSRCATAPARGCTPIRKYVGRFFRANRCVCCVVLFLLRSSSQFIFISSPTFALMAAVRSPLPVGTSVFDCPALLFRLCPTFPFLKRFSAECCGVDFKAAAGALGATAASRGGKKPRHNPNGCGRRRAKGDWHPSCQDLSVATRGTNSSFQFHVSLPLADFFCSSHSSTVLLVGAKVQHADRLVEAR